MKHHLLLFLLFTIPFSSLNAQQSRFGVKGGLNLTTFNGKYANQNTINTGFHFGVYTNVEIGNRFSIQPELQFSVQGAEFEHSGDFEMELYYLNIPVIFKLYPTEKLSIHFGPQFGVFLRSKAELNGEKIGVDDKDLFEPSDTGIALGLAYELENLNFGFRYIAGLTEVIFMEEKLGFPTDEAIKLRNQNLQFYVGYSF
ncbi:MAG: hypothetical protein ACI85I_000510 [Arenicella sp.]|jgi:hypothetical protein